MKMPVSDLMEYCFDDRIQLTEEDETMNQELKEHIMEQIRSTASLRRRHRRVKYLLTGLAAAVMAGTVFATGIFVMNKKQVLPGETEKETQFFLSPGGETEKQEVVFEDVAMTFSFTGEGTPDEVWVKPGYLPEEPEELDPDFMIEGEPGWYQYLSGEYGYTDPIPWQINVLYARADSKLHLLGTVETEKEDVWDGLQVWEVTISRDGQKENYVILFDPENGYMITVAGALEFAELEKIAKGLEIRVTDNPVSMSILDKGTSVINLGRG